MVAPPENTGALDHLDMRRVLGTDGERDAKQAVRLLCCTNSELVSREQSNRVTLSARWSIGRSGCPDDYIWVNLFEWHVVSKEEAMRGRSRGYGVEINFPRARAFDLRMGWDAQFGTFGRGAGARPAASLTLNRQELVTGISPSGAERMNAVSAIDSTSHVPVAMAGDARSTGVE